MKKSYTLLRSLALLLLVAAGSAVQGQAYVEGEHFTALDQPQREGTGKVIEVFWYPCSHCYAFEPLVQDWNAHRPETVAFERSPVMWDDGAREYARLYYTAQALGVTEEIHGRFFNALHQQRKNLLAAEHALDIFRSLGVTDADFERHYASFAVDNKVRQAEAFQRQAGISSVPSMVVDGRYLVTTSEAVPTQEAMLEVVDYLLSRDNS